jgi:hypothetical protein
VWNGKNWRKWGELLVITIFTFSFAFEAAKKLFFGKTEANVLFYKVALPPPPL